MNKKAGIIPNLFNQKELDEWKIYFKQWSKTGDNILNCYGIDKQNISAENWFQKNVFSKVKEALEIDNINSIFGMYAESVNPYPLHTDAYHIEKNNIKGNACISWLVPYQVDNSVQKINLASTIVFNEKTLKEEKNLIDQPIIEKYFNHCDKEKLKKLSIFEIFEWKQGSLIWWNMEFFHCSGAFNDFSIKEMFVGHTFSK